MYTTRFSAADADGVLNGHPTPAVTGSVPLWRCRHSARQLKAPAQSGQQRLQGSAVWRQFFYLISVLNVIPYIFLMFRNGEI